ncbi:MAG: hypothetical protein E7645_00520 [Ruminococcaceae bacterium]|nr:hypothetical protein [Oscillospiraceae bacterium]
MKLSKNPLFRLRTVAALLAAAMLGGALLSCGTPEENEEKPSETIAATQSTVTGNQESIETEEEAEIKVEHDLPAELDYGKDEVVIVSRYREGWTSGEIAVEKITNEPVNDSVYERNVNVEEELNVKIKSIEEDNPDPTTLMTQISTNIKSGSGDYDIVACAAYVTVNEAISGTFANLRQTEYLDFDKPYWSQGYNEVMEYQGAQYTVTGSMVLSLYRFAFITTFNKRLFTETQVEFPYDMVKNKQWTLDYQTSLVPLFHYDNDGTPDDENDLYGLVTTNYISVDPYWSSCDVPIIRKDSNGFYEFVFDSEKLYNVTEKTMKLFYGTDGSTYVYEHYGLDDEQNDIRKMFSLGNAAMATVRIMELESPDMRQMEDEFGVLPMPKYDEAQADYKTLLHDQFTVMAVPTTVTGNRLDEMSAVLECMASEGHKLVRPAYYESALRYKYMKDPESWEMMDIIIENIYIDAGIVYTNALSSFHDQFRQIMVSKNNTVASSYKAKIKSAERALKKMVDKLDKIVNQG